MTIAFCVKCRKMTYSINEEIITLSNGRKSLYSICNLCGGKKMNSLKIIKKLIL